jgi:hypothetical protein
MMAPSYANRKSLVKGVGRRLTRPDEAPVAMTVFVLVDIFVFEQDMGYRQYAINVHCFE